ncbi:hypothetical protein YPPY64_4764, partial [Yersinia pestis PY-64]
MTGFVSVRQRAVKASNVLPRPSLGVNVSAQLGKRSTGSEPLPICDQHDSISKVKSVP